jgi:hypothetical protein
VPDFGISTAQVEDFYNLHLEQWKKCTKKPSKSFIEWQEAFIAPLEKKLNSIDK